LGVPFVFATYPLLAGIDKANMIFNIVFFISVTSVLIQGTTLSAVAKWLNVALPESAKIITPTDAFLSENPKTAMKEILITANCQAADKKVVELKFPKNAIIAMIKRKGKFLVPNGSTVIEANDSLIVLSDTKEGLDKVDNFLRKGHTA
jgi:cell volume regulation protein A